MFCVSCAFSAPYPLHAAARVFVLGSMLVVGGCASQHAANEPPSRVAGPDPRLAGTTMRVEIEDDGLPAQLAPRNRPSIPDDPSEPWSPNYGSKPAKATAEAAPAPSGRRTLTLNPTPIVPPQPQRQAQASAHVLAARFSEAEENDIIRRAIAAHEMRRDD